MSTSVEREVLSVLCYSVFLLSAFFTVCLMATVIAFVIFRFFHVLSLSCSGLVVSK